MVKADRNLTGNARFEGFCIDLLKWIAGQVGFQYAIQLVPDHMYGVYDPETKKWNGIVRELMEKVINDLCMYLPKHYTVTCSFETTAVKFQLKSLVQRRMYEAKRISIKKGMFNNFS